MEQRRSCLYAFIITSAFCLIATGYSIVTPLFESPDELWHYPYVWHIAQTASLPVQAPSEPQLWEHEGGQAPLYYLLAALLTWPVDSSDLPLLLNRNPHADIGLVTPDRNINIIVHTPRTSWPWQGAVLAVHLTRLLSVLLATGTVWLIYLLGLLLYPARPEAALVAMTLVAFNPMFAFIAGAVNNDNMITFTATLTLWQLITLLAWPDDQPLPLCRFVWLGCLTGIAALSKLSGVGMVGLAVLTILWLGWRRRSWPIAVMGNSIVLSLTALIAGWWYGRNLLLYGDWSGTKTTLSIMAPRPFAPTLMQWLHEAAGLLHSFWGVFGYFSLLLPAPIYWALSLLLLIGVGGCCILLLSRKAIKIVHPPPRICMKDGRFWELGLPLFF